MFTREQIERQQLALSRVSLLKPIRFQAELETAFLNYRYLRLLKRIPTIGFVGLVLFTLFSVLDFIFLPADASNITIAIRMLVICPLIVCVILLAIKAVNARFFIYFYAFVYVFSGCGILSIIYTADAFSYSLPYDGILLHLVFGYFLMGLPYRMAITSSLWVSGFYFLVSLYMHLPLEQLISNAIFIISLNFMGAIGSYMQDRARRSLFLNEKLVALAKAKDKKEIAAKTRLVAIASHDLRQPLHAMNMLIEALEAQLTDPSQQTLAKSLNISIKQLSQMLNTLLDISKLNAGIVQAKQETLNLSRKIHALSDEFTFRAKEAGITLICDGEKDVYVLLDPLLFDRILRNVIENIFVHAEATEIKIFWQLNKQTVKLVIVDNGKGIAEAELKTIFDEFRQAGSHSKAGMGLGLSIVKQLAELQGMSYRMESQPGIGTSFHLGLRALPAPSPQQASNILTLHSHVHSDFIENWSSRLNEWGFSLHELDTTRIKHPEDLKALINDKVSLLLWEMQAEHTRDRAQMPLAEEGTTEDQDTLLLDFLAGISGIKLSVLLLVEEEASIPAWQEKLQFLNTSAKDNSLRVEIVSKQVRPAKLRLLLSYLTEK